MSWRLPGGDGNAFNSGRQSQHTLDQFNAWRAEREAEVGNRGFDPADPSVEEEHIRFMIRQNMNAYMCYRELDEYMTCLQEKKLMRRRHDDVFAVGMGSRHADPNGSGGGLHHLAKPKGRDNSGGGDFGSSGSGGADDSGVLSVAGFEINTKNKINEKACRKTHQRYVACMGSQRNQEVLLENAIAGGFSTFGASDTYNTSNSSNRGVGGGTVASASLPSSSFSPSSSSSQMDYFDRPSGGGTLPQHQQQQQQQEAKRSGWWASLFRRGNHTPQTADSGSLLLPPPPPAAPGTSSNYHYSSPSSSSSSSHTAAAGGGGHHTSSSNNGVGGHSLCRTQQEALFLCLRRNAATEAATGEAQCEAPYKAALRCGLNHLWDRYWRALHRVGDLDELHYYELTRDEGRRHDYMRRVGAGTERAREASAAAAAAPSSSFS